MNVDTLDDALYCDWLEEDDDINISVEDNKAMHEMFCDATIMTMMQQQLQIRKSHRLLVGFIVECSIPLLPCGGIQKNESYTDDYFVSNGEPSGKCAIT